MHFIYALLLPSIVQAVSKEFKFVETKDITRIGLIRSRLEKLSASFKGKVGEDIIKRKVKDLSAECTVVCDDEMRSIKYNIICWMKKPTLEECLLKCLKKGLLGLEKTYVVNLQNVYVH
uniref:Uncharacterized protein n=1 Tax=Trichuris muris TaxID=70415 RepID=A0A5S6QJL1_TRIMR